MHINELKYIALKDATGGKGHINELEYLWLESKIGALNLSLNEMWYREFVTGAIGTKDTFSWNTNAFIYLGEKGATANSLSGRWYQFWESGSGSSLSAVSLGVGWSRVGINDYQFDVPPGVNFVAMTLLNVVIGNNYNVKFDAAGTLPVTALLFKPGNFTEDVVITPASYDIDFLAQDTNGTPRFAVQDITGVTQFKVSNLVVTNA